MLSRIAIIPLCFLVIGCTAEAVLPEAMLQARDRKRAELRQAAIEQIKRVNSLLTAAQRDQHCTKLIESTTPIAIGRTRVVGTWTPNVKLTCAAQSSLLQMMGEPQLRAVYVTETVHRYLGSEKETFGHRACLIDISDDGVRTRATGTKIKISNVCVGI